MCVCIKGRSDKDTVTGRSSPIRREIRLDRTGNKSNQRRRFADFTIHVHLKNVEYPLKYVFSEIGAGYGLEMIHFQVFDKQIGGCYRVFSSKS